MLISNVRCSLVAVFIWRALYMRDTPVIDARLIRTGMELKSPRTHSDQSERLAETPDEVELAVWPLVAKLRLTIIRRVNRATELNRDSRPPLYAFNPLLLRRVLRSS